MRVEWTQCSTRVLILNSFDSLLLKPVIQQFPCDFSSVTSQSTHGWSWISDNMQPTKILKPSTASLLRRCLWDVWQVWDDCFRWLSVSAGCQAQAAVEHRSRWSYVSGPGYPPLMGLTIGQTVDSAADKYGDREAVVVTHQNIRRTYTQVQAIRMSKL